jgi:signal transduction histidine kinase
MRWPIQNQLLAPMLSVVVLTIVLATAASAYFGGRWARRQQHEALTRVVQALTDTNFPLSSNVLSRMSGLSGAEFILVDSAWRTKGATITLAEGELAPFRASASFRLEDLPESPVVRVSQRRYLWARVPVPSPSGKTDWLVVLYPEDLLWTASLEAMWPSLIAGGVSIAVVIVVTTLLARRFVRPIRQLGRHAEAIAGGDFQPWPLSARNDELRDLARSMNTIAERLTQYERTVRSSERLRMLEQLGAGMAHQLRNWATGARMAMQLHQRRCSIAGDESLGVALRQLTLIEVYVRRFLKIGSPGEPAEHGPVDMAALVREALSLVGPACEHGNVRLTFAQLSAPVILGDGDQLQQVLINLVLNAVEAASQPGNDLRAVEVTLDGDEQVARIAICDSGPGPREGVQQRLFEPFVSDKKEGTGLGLAVARQIVEKHAGSLSWSRGDDRTSFCIELPLAAQVTEIVA